LANDKDFKVKNGLQVGKDATFDSDLNVSGIITGIGSGLTRLKASIDSSGGAPSVSAGADSGELFFDLTESRLEVWDGASFIPVLNPLDAFAIVQLSTFTAGTGSLIYTPQSAITLKSIDATLAEAGDADIEFKLVKNGTTDIGSSFTISSGQTSLGGTQSLTETVIGTTDNVRLDIVAINSSTTHSHLTVEVNYTVN